jgi:hypothetical protein
MVEGEVIPGKVFLAGEDRELSPVLLGVKQRPIDENLPAIALRHRVKYLPTFQRSAQIELRNAQVHKVFAMTLLLTDFHTGRLSSSKPIP